MRMKVYKYPLQVTDSQFVDLPPQSKILTVQLQHGHPMMWALVHPYSINKAGPRHILIVGTGNGEVPETAKYISTFQVEGGTYVFHVFEL